MKSRNPFEFEAANNLTNEEIIDYYIDDYNYSRFINTTRNIFLQGARGTGKTMALLYNSFNIQYQKSKKKGEPYDFSKIGIYIPCNTPLFHKKEHLLLENDFQAFIINEHYLVLTIANSIAEALSAAEGLKIESPELRDEFTQYFEYILNTTLPDAPNFLKAISLFTQKETYKTQKLINENSIENSFSSTLTFSSLILPFLTLLKKIPELSKTHFLILIDDAHDLNHFQKEIINSWIAYRDHSHFSFKVATAELHPNFLTSSGGVILEGHDFISVDMLKPYQNRASEFGKLARKIIEQRLIKYEINISADEFFPVSKSFISGIDESREIIRKEAKLKYPNDKGTQVSDYVTKYTRSHYFKTRSPQANLPPYSGLDIIIDISTGVIRNLLDPCYWMFDAVLSEKNNDHNLVEQISPNIQQDILINRSNKLWERLENLSKTNLDCTDIEAREIYHMFQNLMVHFKERLMSNLSEPRTVTFIISSQDDTTKGYLDKILNTSIKAQLLYTRSGKSKKDGKRITVYVPNRLLLLSYGLDPHGQYAYASIKSKDLYKSAKRNVKIPLPEMKGNKENNDITLFDQI